MDTRRQVDGRDAKRGRQVGGGGAAEAVAAAGKSLVVPMLMLVLRFGVPVMVGVLLGTGRAVSDVQMKRSMGVAVGQSERQQQDQAAREQGSRHDAGTHLRRWKTLESRIAQDRLKVKSGPLGASAGGPGGIGSQ